MLMAGAGFCTATTPLDESKREQKIQACMVAFMTKELKFTEEEAQRFWPIHSQYENEMKT